MRSLDLFSCIGCQAEGFRRAGIETVAFCEVVPKRRAVIAQHFPGVNIHDDVRTFVGLDHNADIVIGGPPCQTTSIAAAIHGKRSGKNLWPDMLRIIGNAKPGFAVVEQPTGNKTWEAEVCRDLSSAGFYVARFEFGACDIGAPYLRRRLFVVACTSSARLALTRAALPSACRRVKRAADARGDWSADKLGTLRVDARSADEMDRGHRSAARRARIEALGDSNPPHMVEAIGRAIIKATHV